MFLSHSRNTKLLLFYPNFFRELDLASDKSILSRDFGKILFLMYFSFHQFYIVHTSSLFAPCSSWYFSFCVFQIMPYFRDQPPPLRVPPNSDGRYTWPDPTLPDTKPQQIPDRIAIFLDKVPKLDGVISGYVEVTMNKSHAGKWGKLSNWILTTSGERMYVRVHDFGYNRKN